MSDNVELKIHPNDPSSVWDYSFLVTGQAPDNASNYDLENALMALFGGNSDKIMFDSEMGQFFAYTKDLKTAEAIVETATSIESILPRNGYWR